MRHQSKLFAGLLCLISFSLTACQSIQKKQAVAEIVPADREKAMAEQLGRNLDQAYGAWSDPDVEQILNSTLAKLHPELKGCRVHLLSTRDPYVAAGLGDTIFLSRGAIEAIVYENELAFVLATQLALIKEKVPTLAVASLQGQEVSESLIKLPTAPPVVQKDYLERGWFEPGGLFDYGSTAYLKAELEAVHLMYDAKYDPRGAITLIQRWTTPPGDEKLQKLGKILPDPEERLKAARDEVAKMSPMRDPIVRSVAFDKLQLRLHSKKAKSKGSPQAGRPVRR